MMSMESRTFLSGQRFRIAFPKMGTIVPLALTERDFKIMFRAGGHQTLTLAPEGLTLVMVAGAVELIRDRGPKGEHLGYHATCTACHAESKRQKVRSPRLESWANAHRCGREMVLAPDARKERRK
jgi:hypothetical protein